VHQSLCIEWIQIQGVIEIAESIRVPLLAEEV